MYLDELQPQRNYVSWGHLGLGGLLGYDSAEAAVVVGGKRYAHALSAHAPSHLIFDLSQRFTRFRCSVALNDDSCGKPTHASFQIVVDGRSVWNAAHIVPGQAPKAVDLNVTGASKLELLVQTDRFYFCHSLWLDPCLDEAPRPTEVQPNQLSVIIAVYGQRALTEQCLRTLRADAPETEIICVNNGSPDDSATWLAAQEGIRVIDWPDNRGVACAWNAGLHAATGAILCVLNNDTILHPGGISRLRDQAHTLGIAATVGGILRSNETRLEFDRHTTIPAEADYAEGSCLMFRRDVWEAVGDFDEIFFPAYCEDVDWCLRARARGYSWGFVPDALTHLGQKTAETVPHIREGERHNQRLLAVRWKDKGIQERILIRRWAAMGDVLMATPAIAALRRQKPLARIYLQTAPPFCALLKGIPILDGISDTIVWEHTHYYDLDWTYEPEDVKGTWRHPTLEYARRLGVPISGEAYHVPDTPELDAWARELLPQEAGIACGLRSTFRPKANWNAPAWRDLVAALPDSTFVLLDTERRPALDVVGGPAATPLFQMPNVVDLTGRIPSLRHLLAVLRRCKACVSVDTGLLHLAHAAGLPVVGLYGGSAAWARAPLAGGSLAIQGMAPCYPCAHTHLCTRTDGPHCLGWVTGNYVASALRRLLK